MSNMVKTWTKELIRLCRFEVRRLPRFGVNEWLKGMDIRTVLDIGANTGQFASDIHRLLPEAMVYSFEPLEDCYEELKNRMRNVSNFEALNVALGDTKGELDFHRSEHSPSSSVLPMAELHKRNYPYAVKDTLTRVQSVRLDDIAKDLNIRDDLLIKMDVQGFEDKIIAGGNNTIGQAAILLIETAFQPLYVGQPLFEDIHDMLKERFRYMGLRGVLWTSKIDGSPIFGDSIFVRRPT